MDFSEEWKSVCTISSIYDPPLLISRPSSKSLGPLLFTPSPQTLTHLLSSPFLSSPFALPPFSFPRGKKPSQSHQIPTFNNNLQMLKYSKNQFLLFFPFGDDLDRIGFVKLSSKGSKFEVLDNANDDNILQTEEEFDSQIGKISVSPLLDGSSGIIGFLFACTFDTVRWYRVEIRSSSKKPFLSCLGSKEFSHSLIHACWNPHLPEETLILLENGEMFLFDLDSCSMDLEGIRINVSSEGFDLDLDEDGMTNVRWLSCGFSWHPRIFVVACSSAVFLVDGRVEESNVSLLAKIDMFHLNWTFRNSEFIAFSMAGSDGWYFTVATTTHLFLVDIRKPMMPVLQWAHGHDNPRYVNVFRLSELRSVVKEDNHKWASESGFAIMLGSFLSSKFSLFCYGPPLPSQSESVASKVSKFNNSLYAWELPLEISMLGQRCNCGNCILEQDFCNAALPKWKKERILGFCVICEDAADAQLESDGSSGFTLIRLVSSGKLESQKYCASYDFTNVRSKGLTQKFSQTEDPLLDLFIDQTYKFPKRFRYLHLDSLLGFINGNLPKVLISKMRRIYPVSSKTTPYTRDKSERVCDILKAAGVNDIGFCPAIENVLSGISWPMNVHEITSSTIWGGLNIDLLQLAFMIYSDLVGVLIEHRKITLEALDIPMLPQLPPFFAKTPTSRGHKWSWKLQLDDVLVGPVLPLPYLLSLDKVKKDKNSLVLENEENEEAEVARQCNKVMMVASEMALSGSHPEIDDSLAVSLSNDREERWDTSQERKSIFFLKPSAFSGNKSSMDIMQQKSHYEDQKFDTFISKTRENENTSQSMKEPVGLDVFDDMCPIELNFDYPEMTFGVNELKGYKLLKRQFSKWQNETTQYQDFCKSLKVQKTAP